jgi:hypothetical protein
MPSSFAIARTRRGGWVETNVEAPPPVVPMNDGLLHDLLGRLGVFKADNWDHLSLGVEGTLGCCTKVRRQSRDTRNRPVQLNQLGDDLVTLLDQHATTNAEIAIPPSVVWRSGVRGHAELNVSCLVGHLRHRLQLGCESIYVSRQNRSTVSGLVLTSNTESHERTAVTLDEVFALRLDLPRIPLAELFPSSLFQLGLHGIDAVEDGRVVGQEVTERLRVLLGVLAGRLLEASGLVLLRRRCTHDSVGHGWQTTLDLLGELSLLGFGGCSGCDSVHQLLGVCIRSTQLEKRVLLRQRLRLRRRDFTRKGWLRSDRCGALFV